MTPDEIKAEIAEARRILREDKILAGNKAIQDKLNKQYPDEPTGTPPTPPEGTPPPPAQLPPKPDPEKKKGMWWGNALDN